MYDTATGTDRVVNLDDIRCIVVQPVVLVGETNIAAAVRKAVS